jgi:hypothetical protein
MQESVRAGVVLLQCVTDELQLLTKACVELCCSRLLQLCQRIMYYCLFEPGVMVMNKSPSAPEDGLSAHGPHGPHGAHYYI